MWKCLALALCGALNTAAANPVYKWVDADGVVHFSDQRPADEAEAEELVIDIPVRPRPFASVRPPGPTGPPLPSLSMVQLGPLPENAVSEYAQTVGADIAYNVQRVSGRFVLGLQPTSRLPTGAYLEAHFPDPADSSNTLIVGETWRGSASRITLQSPESQGLRCRNYEVPVQIYMGSARTVLLGTHRQSIQSRLNLSKVGTAAELGEAMLAMAQGEFNCP